MFLGSRKVLGVRQWNSSLRDSESFGFSDSDNFLVSNNFAVLYAIHPHIRPILAVSKCLGGIGNVHALLESWCSDTGPAPKLKKEDLDSCFTDIAGPWACRETWADLFRHGASVFKRRVDHRVMVFKSLVFSRDTDAVSRSLQRLLRSECLTADQIFGDEIGRILGDCDMFVIDPDTATCHVASVYARYRLQALADEWSSDSLASRFKRYLGF